MKTEREANLKRLLAIRNKLRVAEREVGGSMDGVTELGDGR